MTDPTTKQCPLCKEPVQNDARKCPHCQHFLNQWTFAAYHPAIALIPFALIIFASVYFLGRVFRHGENFDDYKSQVRVEDSRMEFGQNSKGEETVAVVGTIRNDSPIPWKDVEVEIQYRDSAKKVFDAKTSPGYSTTVPAHSTGAFKISQAREFPKGDYQLYSANVLWARDARTWLP
jgi:hypothetical protein